ncbi:MAG TPA: hypothetical protein VGH50_07115 [Candidatus Binatia bacterium]
MILKNIFAGALLLLLAGCGATQIYEGERRDPSQVAVVHDDRRFYGLANRNVGVVSIDGVERFHWAFAIEVLPGDYTLGIRFIDNRFGLSVWAKTLCYVKFRAEAGHEYNIDSETFDAGDRWRIWLVDRQTGARCDCIYEPAKTEKAESPS